MTYTVQLVDDDGNELTMTQVPEVNEGWKALMAQGGWKVVLVEEESD
jgi:hypothetical protein